VGSGTLVRSTRRESAAALEAAAEAMVVRWPPGRRRGSSYWRRAEN
jgi:hypothetical protein